MRYMWIKPTDGQAVSLVWQAVLRIMLCGKQASNILPTQTGRQWSEKSFTRWENGHDHVPEAEREQVQKRMRSRFLLWTKKTHHSIHIRRALQIPRLRSVQREIQKPKESQ